MKDSSSGRAFGVLVAYVLPGFIVLAGLTPVVPAIARWLQPVSAELGPPLYTTLAATALGMLLSCLRFVTLDAIHRALGARRPEWDDRRLDQVLGGFDFLVLNHFRYHEFAANSLLALGGVYLLNRSLGSVSFLGPLTDAVVLVVCGVLFAASHDALRQYYARTSRLVGAQPDLFGELIMYNGNDHGSATTKRTDAASTHTVSNEPSKGTTTTPQKSETVKAPESPPADANR